MTMAAGALDELQLDPMEGIMTELGTQSLTTRLDRLERENRRWRLGALALVIGCLSVVVGRMGEHRVLAARAADEANNAPEDALASVRSRQKLSREALDIIRASWKVGAPVLNQPNDIYRWSTRLLGAQIYLSMGAEEIRVEEPEVYLALTNVKPNSERLEAFEAHLQRMRDWEDRLRPLARGKIMAPLDFKNIQANRYQAEVWLARERMRLDRAKPGQPKA
jgi:hypothetical protein